MTVAAEHRANERADRGERRKQRRKGTLWHGTLRTSVGVVPCRVLNLSARGAKLEFDAALASGDRVTLIMEPLGEFSGSISWRRDGQAGLRINEHRTTRTEIKLPRSLAGESFPGDY